MTRLVRLTKPERAVVRGYGGRWPREMAPDAAARARAQAALDAKLEAMDLRSWAEYLAELRRADAAPRMPALPGAALRWQPSPLEVAWWSSDAGHPLGHGMPTGRSLRADGETHRQWWMRIVREDPCAYCGRRPAGTLDHIEPQSRSARVPGGCHWWGNYTGACQSCNGSKGAGDLLLFLRERAPRRRRRPLALAG